MDELLEMVFEDENGKEYTCIFIDTLRYQKKDYDLYKRKDEEIYEILEVAKETDDAVEYNEVDQELFDLLFKKFQEEMENE